MPQTEARPEFVFRIVKSHHLTIQFPTTLTLSSNHDISIPQLIKKNEKPGLRERKNISTRKAIEIENVSLLLLRLLKSRKEKKMFSEPDYL
jgi:hypothetical protein